jgi:MYXO-CTERM domain-containing protein
MRWRICGEPYSCYDLIMFEICCLGRSRVLKKIALSALLVGLSSSSFAGNGNNNVNFCDWPWPFDLLCVKGSSPLPTPTPPPAHNVPEMDANVGIGAAALLVGGLIVLRSRRRSS